MTRPLLCLLLLLLPATAMAAEKHVYKVDSLLASLKGNTLTVQARRAVSSGGWSGARLRGVHAAPGQPHTLVLDFVATPPSADAVVEGLMPVSARIVLKVRPGIVAVAAQAEANAITTQVLH